MIRKDNFRSPGSDDPRQQKVFKDRVCYGYGKSDHIIRDCPQKTFTRSRSNLKAVFLEADEGQSKEICKTESEKEVSEFEQVQEKSAATCIVITPSSNPCSMAHSQLETDTKVKNIYGFEIVNIVYHSLGELACREKPAMPVREGLVGKMRVSVLRDSGCNSVLVKNKLVEEEEYTGKKVT